MKRVIWFRAVLICILLAVPAFADFDNWYFKFLDGSAVIHTTYKVPGQPDDLNIQTYAEPKIEEGVLKQKATSKNAISGKVDHSTFQYKKTGDQVYEGEGESNMMGAMKFTIRLLDGQKFECDVTLGGGAKMTVKGRIDEAGVMHSDVVIEFNGKKIEYQSESVRLEKKIEDKAGE